MNIGIGMVYGFLRSAPSKANHFLYGPMAGIYPHAYAQPQLSVLHIVPHKQSLHHFTYVHAAKQNFI